MSNQLTRRSDFRYSTIKENYLLKDVNEPLFVWNRTNGLLSWALITWKAELQLQRSPWRKGCWQWVLSLNFDCHLEENRLIQWIAMIISKEPKATITSSKNHQYTMISLRTSVEDINHERNWENIILELKPITWLRTWRTSA